ncbi:MAG: alpha/beta fold hydrolase [Candidatus Eremiobacteraeota bacterium]|nr:alpha/beta fold hydrolase [Candidatus Eremiobacteraeota bacterium]
MSYLSGGEPFSLPGQAGGVLLLHGFTGSPFEIRALGESLHRQGYGVLAPALPGHATLHTDLDSLTAADYFAAAEEAYETGMRIFNRLYVAGLSMGGVLALHLAATRPVSGVLAISTPVFLSPFAAMALPIVHQWLPKAYAPANISAWQGNVVGYKTASVVAFKTVADVLENVKAALGTIHAPIMIVHSTRDATAPVGNARYIFDHVSSCIRRLKILRQGRHLLTLPRYLPLFETDVLAFFGDLEAAAAR